MTHDDRQQELEQTFCPEGTQPKVSVAAPVKDLENCLEAFNKEYPLAQYQEARICMPGAGEIYVRRVTRLGHKGDFPRSYDWENILPQLHEDEELLWIIRKRGSMDEMSLEKQSGATSELSFEVYIGLKFVGAPPRSFDEWKDRKRRFAVITRGMAKSAFPETVLEKDMDENECARFLDEIATMPEALVVSGMPSIKDSELREVAAKRDENTRPWAGLNDIIEMHSGTDENFALVFSVSKVPHQKIVNDFNALFTIQNTIKPLLERTVQCSESTSHTLSVTDTSGESESSTDTIDGGDRQERRQRGIAPRMGRGIMNFFRWIGGTSGDGVKEFENQKYVKKIGTQQQHSKQTSHSETVADGETHGKSWTVKEVNAALMFADKHIDESIGQLTQTLGTGGYLCGAAVYSTDYFVARSVADATCATLSGGQSALHPMRVHAFEFPENKDWLIRCKSLSRVMDEDGMSGGILNCEKACMYLPLPTTHLPGLPIKKNVFYGKEQAGQSGELQMGAMSFAEPHVINDRTLDQYAAQRRFTLFASHEDLYSHLFVVGTTGCGKTTRAAKLLHDAIGVRKIILETAKKTYWQELGMGSDELLVYTLGDSNGRPLRFNPFFFEKGSSLKQHIAVLADAISDLLPMEALIGPKLREAVERCYHLCGWDIETSTRSTDAKCRLEYPNVAMFSLVVKQIADELTDYSDEVRGNYTGALLNRAAIFMDDVYQDIFAFDGNKPIDEIFPPDKTVIIEMEEMPPSEINMPAFITSLLLHRIRSCQNRKSREGTIDECPGFLIAIEEAHNVLSASIQDKHDEMQSGKGAHLVKQVVRLLAEGRGLKMGLMVIDQSAANIAPAVITNTNTKLVFRQEDGKEIETIGKAIGLKSDEWNDLQLLEKGEYLLRNSRFPRPIKMAPLTDMELPKRKRYSRSDFFDNVCVPGYQRAEDLLVSYCRTDGIVKNGDEVVFVGYEHEKFERVRERLKELTLNDEELLLYLKIKILLKLRYYKTAELELRI